jgi:hypothetical protein
MDPASVQKRVLSLNGLALRLRDLRRRLLRSRLDARPLRMVALETTTECTRRCAYCPPHSGLEIPRLRMSEEVYRRVLASLAARAYSGDIFFSLYGDSLCDDRLEAWLAQARAKLPKARLLVFTNGDLLTRERYLSLKAAGMDMMPLSLHDKVMRQELQTTLDGLKRDFPSGYCVGEVDYYSQFYGPVGDVGLLNNKGGLADVRRRPFGSCCDVESAAVDCLGNVLLCNNDCTSSCVLGSVLRRDLFEIWEDPAFVSARLRIMRGEWLFEICRRCMSPAGRVTAAPAGAAVRLPPAFTDFDSVMEKEFPGFLARRGGA